MIKDKMKKLTKKKKLIDILLFPGFLFWCFLVSGCYKYVDVFLVIIENIFNIDGLFIILLRNFNDYFYLFLPLVLYDGFKMEKNKTLEEIENLNFEYQIVLQKERKKIAREECKIIDEEEIKKLYNIVERFEGLSREKQMEVLNYIKGDLNLRDKEIALDIDKLSDKYKDYLQTECEDIIFPDYDDGNNYTKKKKK